LRERVATSAEEEMSAQQLLAAIQTAIEKLWPQSRDALLLREMQDVRRAKKC
jgi:DNA-directed RNA polymerase specialized sigma24 family protein